MWWTGDLPSGQQPLIHSQLVVFRLRPSDLAYYNQSSNKFTIAPGSYTVLVGTSSTELDHVASFKVGQ